MSDNNSDRERQRLAEAYASMADGELQLLARSFSGLSIEARQALESEFLRRDLLPEVDLYAPDPGQDVIEWDNLVMIRQFRDLPEALLAKGSLESSGIKAFLLDDNIVRMDWFISNLVGGAKLWVYREDVESAFDVLEQATPASLDIDGVGTYEQPSCPLCQSLDVTFEALNRPVAYASAWVGVPIPLKRERWKCNACGHVWKTEESSTGTTPGESGSPGG